MSPSDLPANTVASGVPETPLPWRDIFGVIASVAVVGIGLSFGQPLLALIMEQRGISGTVIGLHTAVTGFAAILVAPFVPRVTAVIPSAWVLIAAIAGCGLICFCFYLTDNLWIWFFLRFGFATALTFVFVVSEFWINTLASDQKRGRVIGIYATVLYGGLAAGPILLALVGTTGFLPFFVCGGVMLLGIVPVFMAAGSSPSPHSEDRPPFIPFIFSVPLATLAAFIFGAAEAAGMSFFAIYGTRLGFEEGVALSLVTALAIGGIIFQVPLGYLADKVNRRVLLLAMGMTGVLGYAIVPLAAGNPALLFAVILIAGGITGGLYTVGLAHLGSIHRGAALAAANAAFIFLYSLGTLIGPLTTGIMGDLINPHGIPLAIMVFFAIYMVIALFRLSNSEKSVAIN